MEGGFLPEEPATERVQQKTALPAVQQQQAAPQRQQPPKQQRQQQQQQRPSVYRPLPPAAGTSAPPDAELLDEHPEAAAGCSRCSSLTFNSEWLRAFGVVLCNQCKQGEALISKSTAKQRYSLSDADLAPLGSLRKANPHKKDWQAMHLFMESQVARVAHDKHGGVEGLQEHQQARLDAKLQAKLRRREEERRREEREGARLARIRQRIEGGGEDEGAQRAAAAQASDEEEI